MEYALDRLDGLVTCGLKKQPTATYLLEQVEKETTAIRRYLWEVPHRVKNEKQLLIIIPQYHRSLQFLCNNLRDLLAARADADPSMRQLYESVHASIAQLISLLERHFSIWLHDKKAPAPFFLHTPMNEAEVSALLCAMIDTGVLTNYSYSRLFNLVAPVLATRHKQGLAAASMLKSKDKLTADMKKKVKGMLLEMARMVENY